MTPVKIQGLSDNVSSEAQILNLLNQLQKQKEIVTREEFENAAELDEDIEAALADTEIFQAGYLKLCGMVYCLEATAFPSNTYS